MLALQGYYDGNTVQTLEKIQAKKNQKLLQRASNDLDNIYNPIADNFKEIGTAEKMADTLEKVILRLDEMASNI